MVCNHKPDDDKIHKISYVSSERTRGTVMASTWFEGIRC